MATLARTDEPALRQRIRTLAEAALHDDLDVLLLFGSRARGDAVGNSDWDVLALLKDTADRERSTTLLMEVTGRLAEEAGEQVNFKAIRPADAAAFAALLRNIDRDGVRL